MSIHLLTNFIQIRSLTDIYYAHKHPLICGSKFRSNILRKRLDLIIKK